MAESPQAPPIPAENSFLKAIRQPRFLLILLAVWAIIGALTEFFTSSGLFVDLHGRELDGALGGRSLSWEAIPLAILYLYAARDPKRYHPVFWLASSNRAWRSWPTSTTGVPATSASRAWPPRSAWRRRWASWSFSTYSRRGRRQLAPRHPRQAERAAFRNGAPLAARLPGRSPPGCWSTVAPATGFRHGRSCRGRW